jgi:fatty-acyl-CoA synthase
MLDREPTIAVNDETYGPDYFERCFARFERSSHLRRSRGKRYAVCCSDPAEWIALCLYLRASGGSVAPLHSNTPLEAAKRLALKMGCEALLFHDVENFLPLGEGQLDEHGVLLQLTSGTTGEAKCVQRTWDSLDLEIAAYNRAFGGRVETPLLACPVTHAYGLISGVLSALARGQRPLLLANINPKYVIRRSLEDRDRLLYASPTLLNVLIRLLPEGGELCPVMTSGAPLAAAWFQELSRRSRRVSQQYGCSEVGCISVAMDARSADDVGVPLDLLQVTAGAGRRSLDEIHVRTEGRVVETRDLGFLQGDRLFFAGRKDDTINVAGINVYPRDVEDVVLEFPDIVEAVVYKRPDPYAGERVCVKFVATRSVDTTDLRAFCATNLSPFAVPLEMQQVEAIPWLDNGKIDRRRLVESEAGQASTTG